MIRVIRRLQQIQLRQVLSAFLVGMTFFLSAALGQISYIPSAQAAATPKAAQYNPDGNSTGTASGIQIDTKNSKKNLQANTKEAGGFVGAIKDAAENVTEKLNLNEPLPESTKEFLDSVTNDPAEATQNGLKDAAAFPQGGYSH
ncbi:hypothetical protein H6F90_24720 [Trichocoleus sp. FACHB-591]|uniref:hypothetical protein n=1 Tax=Trichocoleus sp. FACHB-591 TaxID=2692872 RepID=UPI001685E932|nr:hypothetical protein [Trichocoleus sp. FACHB-591]MBD2098277.1 hypothetical protein [Trichocoleus sp. FACHB-591]